MNPGACRQREASGKPRPAGRTFPIPASLHGSFLLFLDLVPAPTSLRPSKLISPHLPEEQACDSPE